MDRYAIELIVVCKKFCQQQPGNWKTPFTICPTGTTAETKAAEQVHRHNFCGAEIRDAAINRRFVSPIYETNSPVRNASHRRIRRFDIVISTEYLEVIP